MAVIHPPSLLLRSRLRSARPDAATRQRRPLRLRTVAPASHEALEREVALARSAMRMVAAGYCTSTIVCGLRWGRTVSRQLEREARSCAVELTILPEGRQGSLQVRRRGGDHE